MRPNDETESSGVFLRQITWNWFETDKMSHQNINRMSGLGFQLSYFVYWGAPVSVKLLVVNNLKTVIGVDEVPLENLRRIISWLS